MHWKHQKRTQKNWGMTDNFKAHMNFHVKHGLGVDRRLHGLLRRTDARRSSLTLIFFISQFLCSRTAVGVSDRIPVSSLASKIRPQDKVSTFKSHLKTFLFTISHSHWQLTYTRARLNHVWTLLGATVVTPAALLSLINCRVLIISINAHRYRRVVAEGRRFPLSQLLIFQTASHRCWTQWRKLDLPLSWRVEYGPSETDGCRMLCSNVADIARPWICQFVLTAAKPHTCREWSKVSLLRHTTSWDSRLAE